MPEKTDRYLQQLNRADAVRHRLRQIIFILSFVVILGVFWSLKLTGIGIAGEAFCGQQEHLHDEECLQRTLICTLMEYEPPGTPDEAQPDAVTEPHSHTDECYEVVQNCGLEEHIHIESCYSNINADLETEDDWEMSLADMTRGPTTKGNVILVAQSQLGQGESTLNFQVDAYGVRRGITRYGQWYGNPYGDWSRLQRGRITAPC